MQASNNTNQEQQKQTVFYRAHWILIAATGLWLLCIAWYQLPIPQSIIERYYSKGLFRFVEAVITLVTGNIPFSVIIPLLIFAIPTFFISWIATWTYRRRTLKQPHWKSFLWGPKHLYILLPLIWFWFLLFWGIGYQRVPLETRLNLTSTDIHADEIHHIENSLLEIIERDQPKQQDDRNIAHAIKSIASAMREIVLEWDGIPIHIPRCVKATPPGMFLMNGTSGMCVPLTLEPHVDGGLPDTAFVAVAAHELGHITGLCDEGETNLLGYAAGLAADYPYARYAVALGIYRSLIRHSSKEEYESAMKRLPEQARKDLHKATEASQRYRIKWIQQWSWRAYNHYLKAQGVSDGVQSYGRGTQLLVYAWRNGHIALPQQQITSEE